MIVQPLTTLQRLEVVRLTEDSGFGLPQGEVDRDIVLGVLGEEHREVIAPLSAVGEVRRTPQPQVAPGRPRRSCW